MRIVADENIPGVEALFGQLGEVRTVSGRAINRAAIAEADVLLVRSVTRVDAALVEGSRLQFVGSATIGTDHVDADALLDRGIAFAHAPGSNADSVAEYVIAALLELATEADRPLDGRVLGIVGHGNIGRRMAQRAVGLGMRVLVNDPPLEEAGGSGYPGGKFVPLEQVLEESDVLTLHVPLQTGGRHPTLHLMNAARLQRLKRDAALINTSRGPVVDGQALRDLLDRRPDLRIVLDVFEGEPEPDPALLERLFLATPHIAGYSFDGKRNGAAMLFEALCAHLARSAVLPSSADDPPEPLRAPEPAPDHRWLHGLVRTMYDIRADDSRLRSVLAMDRALHGDYFTRLRKDYPNRRTFGHYVIPASDVPAHLRKAVAEGLRVQVL